jgi:CheY-like chemotaxis protein
MPSVLLVDPEPSVIVTLKMILERDGYIVSTATSYGEATALLQNESWDILITELDLEAEALGLRLAGEAKSLDHRPAIFVYAS